MKKEKLNRFSIRKLSVGAASVLVGVALAGGATTAFASQPETNSQEEQTMNAVLYKAGDQVVGYDAMLETPTKDNVKVPAKYKLDTTKEITKDSVNSMYYVPVVEKNYFEQVEDEKTESLGLTYKNIVKKVKAKKALEEAEASAETARKALNNEYDKLAAIDTTVAISKASLTVYQDAVSKNGNLDFKDQITAAEVAYAGGIKDQVSQQFKVAAAKAALDKAVKAVTAAKEAYEKLGGDTTNFASYTSLEAAAKEYDRVKGEVATAKAAAEKARLDLEKFKVELIGAKTDTITTLVNKYALEDKVSAYNAALTDYNAKVARLNTLQTLFDAYHKNIATATVAPAATTAATTEVAYQGVAKTFVKDHPNYAVAMMDANGKYTGKFLKQGLNWKVFAKKTINGRVCYRLGTQAQWVPARFLVF